MISQLNHTSIEKREQPTIIIQPPKHPRPLPKPIEIHYPKPTWEKRAIAVLNEGDKLLNEWMPNWILQTKIDELGAYIEKQFAVLGDLDKWIRSDGEGPWTKQLATHLAKLPLRAATNIIHLFYNIVKGILQAGVHPLESLNKVAKLMVLLAHALTQPETWAKIGSGMIGAGLGQAAAMNMPVSIMGMVIGSALTTAGLSFSALKAAIHAATGKKATAATESLKTQMTQLPETALTGFGMGLITGAIRNAKTQHKTEETRIKLRTASHTAGTLEEARKIAEEFIKKNNLPSAYRVILDRSGNIEIQFDVDAFVDRIPALNLHDASEITEIKVLLSRTGDGTVLVDRLYYLFGDDPHMIDAYSLAELGLSV